MKNKKEKIIAILLVVGLIVVTGSISYAAFRFSGLGSKVNTITTGSITMSYTESSNVLSMSGALPTTDATGKTRLNPGEYFDFTVSSSITGDVNINYEISVEELSGNTISGDFIKFYLTRVDTEGNEEEVMAPSTYSAELNANTYTGRPANMMSLYTSSMTSSEVTTYRLRMYVSEEYNPQGDGGNLVFKARVNVYGLAGDKMPSQVITKLFKENPVQDTIDFMFNYTNEGKNPYNSNGSGDANYITNGMYMMEDEDGPSYYFRGNVDNLVQFGYYAEDYYAYRYKSSSSFPHDFRTLDECKAYNKNCSESNKVLKHAKGTPMFWKIVRINGDGTLRLLYSGVNKEAYQYDLSIGTTKYNDINNEPKYAGYTYDNGTDSRIKQTVDDWYNIAFSNGSYDKYVILGRFCNDTSGYDGKYYANRSRLMQGYLDKTLPNTPTLKCPETTEDYGGSYTLKAGLITADEVTLGGYVFGTSGNNYLKIKNYNYYTMTPLSFNYDMVYIWQTHSALTNTTADHIYTARPVINVNVDDLKLTGSGTIDDYYVLSEK